MSLRLQGRRLGWRLEVTSGKRQVGLPVGCIIVAVLTRVLKDAQQLRVGADGKEAAARVKFGRPNGLLIFDPGDRHKVDII